MLGMNKDFLASQIAALGPLDFVRVWVQVGDDKYSIVGEVAKSEDESALTIRGGSPFTDDKADQLVSAGLEGGTLVVESTDPVQGAARLTELVGILAPEAIKLSLTHGSTLGDVLRDRRLQAVVQRINEVLGESATPGAWRHSCEIPVRLRAETVELTLWPKDSPPNVFLEVWALVANRLPDSPEVNDLIARSNERFSFGRLLRQESVLWYRETIHADPLTDAALRHAVNMAAFTAKGHAPLFAKLGAVNLTVPSDSPLGATEQPAEVPIERIGGYL